MNVNVPPVVLVNTWSKRIDVRTPEVYVNSLTLVPDGTPVPPDTVIPTAMVPDMPDRFEIVV